MATVGTSRRKVDIRGLVPYSASHYEYMNLEYRRHRDKRLPCCVCRWPQPHCTAFWALFSVAVDRVEFSRAGRCYFFAAGRRRRSVGGWLSTARCRALAAAMSCCAVCTSCTPHDSHKYSYFVLFIFCWQKFFGRDILVNEKENKRARMNDGIIKTPAHSWRHTVKFHENIFSFVIHALSMRSQDSVKSISSEGVSYLQYSWIVLCVAHV